MRPAEILCSILSNKIYSNVSSPSGHLAYVLDAVFRFKWIFKKNDYHFILFRVIEIVRIIILFCFLQPPCLHSSNTLKIMSRLNKSYDIFYCRKIFWYVGIKFSLR